MDQFTRKGSEPTESLSELAAIAGTLFLFAQLVLFISWTLLETPSKMFTPSESSSISCNQLPRLSAWARSRYGGNHSLPLESQAYGRAVMEKFIDKIDPHKVLFLQVDADRLIRQGGLAWEEVLRGGRCTVFETVFQEDFSRASQRATTLIQKMPMESIKIGSRFGEWEELNDAFPKYKNFSKSKTEQAGRLLEYGSLIGNFTGAHVLAAYGGDKRQLVTDALHQLMSEDNSAVEVLAKGVLGTFDSYSTYFSTPEFEDFFQELAAESTGVGIKIRKVPGGLLIDRIVKSSPAERSQKIKVGDIIEKVDGQSMASATYNEAKKALKGAESSQVSLHLRRGLKQRFHVQLKRESYAVDDTRVQHSVHHPKKNAAGSVAVIEIPSFYGRSGFEEGRSKKSSAEDLEIVLQDLGNTNQRPSAVVLDLRGNPGGYLEEAVSMGGIFLGEKPVVGVVERSEKRVLKDTRAPLYKGPLVVLLDKDSASAAEVLAGALKDYRRALIVGEGPSYGKGTVQRLYHLQDEFTLLGTSLDAWQGVVKITTSIFYSPLGHSPANGGVSPHVVLHSSPDSAPLSSAPRDGVPEEKPILDAAALSDLKRSEPSWSAKVELLKNFENSPCDVTPDGDLTAADAPENDCILSKTVNLAAQYASLIYDAPGTKALTVEENSTIRNVRRDVIGY